MARRLALLVVVLLALGAAPAAARDLAVAVPGQAGNDRTCDPCRTIGGALAKAATLPGRDRIALGRGVYREDLAIGDPHPVSIYGLGAATQIVGRIAVNGPPSERLPDGSMRVYEYDPDRAVALIGLALRSTDGVVRVRDAVLQTIDVDIAGRIRAEGASLRLLQTTVTTPSVGPCDSSVSVIRAPTTLLGGTPERHSAGTIQESMIVGGSALAVVDADLDVARTILIADAAGCAGSDAVRVIGGGITLSTSLIARGAGGVLGAAAASPGGNGIYGDNATIRTSLTTIGGSFEAGLRMQRCFVAQNGCGGVYDLRAVAIVGARDGIVLGEGVRANALAWIVATGPFLQCRAQNACLQISGVERGANGQPTGNVFGQLLEDPTSGPDWAWYPRPRSPLVDAVTDNAGNRAVGSTPDLAGSARPVPIAPGGAALYDVGAFEHPTVLASPAVVPALGTIGPGWAGIDLGTGGVIGGVIGGLGVPLRPGVAGAPDVGSAAAPASPGAVDAAAAEATVARAPRLEIVLPRRARQGDVVRVRVKAPWQGRLSVRVYGAQGGLINVGRGRKVNRGWRVVEVRLGPNARVGPMRVLATHTRAGKDILSATGTAAVVARPRG